MHLSTSATAAHCPTNFIKRGSCKALFSAMALNSDSYTNRDEKSGLLIVLVWMPALRVFCFVSEEVKPFSQSLFYLLALIKWWQSALASAGRLCSHQWPICDL